SGRAGRRYRGGGRRFCRGGDQRPARRPAARTRRGARRLDRRARGAGPGRYRRPPHADLAAAGGAVMSRQTVLVYRDLPEPQLARILAEHEVIRADPRREDQREAFFDALGRVQGMIGSSFRLDAALLDRAPALKVVSSVSVGVDAYPLAALRERGIVLCHTPGVLTESVADLLFGMVLATSRRLCDMAGMVREGRWVRNVGPEEYGWDVHGKTLGIVGYGRIGQALARRAALGFGMPVVYHARRPVESGLPPGKARAAGL